MTSQRWAGTERLNLQNLRRGGALRRAIVALPGNAIVVGDMANIELRVNHCMAGQADSVSAFVERRDLYSEFAARLFNKPAAEITKDERFLGKLCHLSLGYSCSYKKFREICRLYKVDITEERAQEIVSLWRHTYRAIPRLWAACDESLNAMANGSIATIGHGPVILTFTNGDTCGFDLASGHRIRYADLQSTGDGWTYYTNRGRKTIYGGKCVSGETLVLTIRGWVKLKYVRSDDLLHDGVGFVPHGGAVFTGRKPCVMIDGVLMTPDHMVLTDDGWKVALEKPRPYRPDLRHADCASYKPLRWAKAALAVFVCVREYLHKGRLGCNEGGEARRHAELRLRNEFADERTRTEFTPDVEASSVLGMAQHAGSVFATDAPGLGQLRRAWNFGVRAVEKLISSVLGGYGRHLRARAHARQDRQQRGVLQAELPMGDVQAASPESPRAFSGARLSAVVGRDWHSQVNAAIPPREGGATDRADACRAEADVYDIVNAGTRHQFVVRGDAGPFIVHNCVENLCQSISRHILGYQWLLFAGWLKANHPSWAVVLQVHDELVATGPEDEAPAVAAGLEQALSTAPPWWPDLPLAAEVGWAKNYGEAKS